MTEEVNFSETVSSIINKKHQYVAATLTCQLRVNVCPKTRLEAAGVRVRWCAGAETSQGDGISHTIFSSIKNQ